MVRIVKLNKLPKDSSRSYAGYSEKKITDLEELKLLISGLELDEGIRFVANFEGYKDGAFVFLSRCGDNDKFCANLKERVYDEASRSFVPGMREEWKYFDRPSEVWSYTKRILKPPVEAYYY